MGNIKLGSFTTSGDRHRYYSLKSISARVETKIFVFDFRENFAKISFRFARKKLTKSYENNESFRENFRFHENDAGSENAVKHPNSKRQTKLRSFVGMQLTNGSG
jgi:hypothetical protein